jgi:hypothetical protein
MLARKVRPTEKANIKVCAVSTTIAGLPPMTAMMRAP